MGWFDWLKKPKTPLTPPAQTAPEGRVPKIPEGPTPRSDDAPKFEVSFKARDAYWSQIGTLDEDVLSHLISPGFLGGPVWPTTRQAYRAVRTGHSLILTSDGLSDPYQHDASLALPGYGMEVFAELTGAETMSQEDLMSSPLFRLVASGAGLTADRRGILGMLANYGVLSTEFEAAENMPDGWATPGGGLGALIGMETGRGAAVPGMPYEMPEQGKVRMVAITALRPAEVQMAAQSGEARTELCRMLEAAGVGHLTDWTRASVV